MTPYLAQLVGFWNAWWPVCLLLLVVAVAVIMVGWRLRKVQSERQARALRMRRKRQRKAAQPPKVSPSASMVHEVSREAPERRPLILVVDDSKAAREYTRSILEKQPYRVLVADNGRAAWSYLQDQKPDLIISDIDMPLMTGFELLRLVREDLRLADLPFILMTSHLYAHVQSSQAAGFDSLLPKPYSPEDLVEQVRFLLQE
jgi:CheY-like chemotaxis protein